MPWPRPAQVGWSDISVVHCVIAKTKTRSKKSSRGSTLSSCRRDAPRRRRWVSDSVATGRMVPRPDPHRAAAGLSGRDLDQRAAGTRLAEQLTRFLGDLDVLAGDDHQGRHFGLLGADRPVL